MKKKLSLLLLICILNALCINAEIYSGSCGTNVNYSLNTETGLLSITGTGAMADYSYSDVPWYSNKSYIKVVEISDGVTSIGRSAFGSCSGLTSVTIGNSVTSIGNSAFSDCSNLTSLTIGNSVTSIGKDAFSRCSGLTSVTIPNSVTSIGQCAFYNCSSLTSIEIPNSVTSIGNEAFSRCSGLTSIEIPNSVTSIDAHAFSGCSGVTSIVVESGNTKYDSRDNCNALIETATNTLLSGCKNTIIPSSVTSIGNSAFDECSNLTSVTIPNSVTSIGRYAFSSCYGLTSIEIPSSVTSIGDDAFNGTAWYNNQPNGLVYAGLVAYKYKGTMPENTSITIEEGTLGITSSAFSGCSGLTSVIIPNSVTSIGVEAFYNCSGLTSVIIPNSVTSIGGRAFYNCSGVTSIVVESGNTKYDSRDNCNALIETATNTLLSGCKNTIIPSSVTSIGDYAFYKCSGLTSIEIPNSVTSIGSLAFYNCSGLTSVTIPNSVTSIGMYAFSGTAWYNNQPDGLVYAGLVAYKYKGTMPENTSITIEEGTLEIAGDAFRGCSGLTSITIPSSVTSIGSSAFYNCRGLTSVIIPNSVTSIGVEAFGWCSGLTSVISEIEEPFAFGSSAFSSISSSCILTVPYGTRDAYIAAGWTTDVFKGGIAEMETDTNITSGSCGDNVNYSFDTSTGVLSITGTGAMTDYSSENRAPWYEQRENIKSIEISDGVTSIGDFAFDSCYDLASVDIPNSVTSIGTCAFRNCHHITTVDIPNGVTEIGAQAFERCDWLASIDIPNSVTSIGKSAFEHTALTTVIIGNGVTSIGEGIFNYCNCITSIIVSDENTKYDSRDNCNAIIETATNTLIIGCKNTIIPNSVTSIGGCAFYGSGLTSVTIPNSVTYIGEDAFSGCSGLTSITCEATSVPSTGSSVFSGFALSSATLYVPSSALENYITTDPWSSFGTILQIEEGPFFIETDLTSLFPTDWQGWNGATGYTPTQFAPMVTTNDGRTVQVCEKFDGSIAATGTIFYRTLSGLTNGTYRIELYGAASSTKGRDTTIDSDMTSADEGDETAVYLYAKTPSGTVKQYIPVHWATSFDEVATAVLNEVKVTDGTVEIGMYSEKKFTNWHVVQIKGVTALVDIEELHANTLSKAQKVLSDATYVNITGSERAALEQTVHNNTTVSEGTKEAYQIAIEALETATKTFVDAKESYDAFVSAKSTVAGCNFPYALAEKKSAAEAAYAAAASPTTAAQAESMTASLLQLYRQYAESSAMLEGVDGAENMTEYIKNPKANSAIDASIWRTVRGEGSGGQISILSDQPWTDASGNSNNRYFDGGDYGMNKWDVSFKQQITLPAGHYQLTALGRSSQDVTLMLYAGDNTAEMAHIGSVGGLFNNGWEQTSVEFELNQNFTTIDIGVRGVTSTVLNWMSFSDFRLVKFDNKAVVVSGSCGDNVKYSFDSSTKVLKITGTGAMYDYSDYSYEIPWYSYRSYINSVEISSGVTSIGGEAFADCSNMTSVTIGNSVTSIGYEAFYNCSGLTSVTIPNSVTSIEGHAFDGCSGLTSITIPNSVTSIGWDAFYGCSGLTSVTIPNSVTSIGGYAFYNCSGLTSITIPNSVTSIGIAAFYGCSGLTSVTIPNSVTSIGVRAFYSCSSLTSVTIPNSVTSIGSYAFSDCKGLTSIEIPNSVTSIGAGAFSGCSGLTSVIIGNRVTSIGDYAFDGCSGLTSITIPNSVTNIGWATFSGCYFVKQKFINRSSLDAEANDYWNAIIVDSRENGLVIKDGVLIKYIGKEASVTIPNSVTSIGRYAFSDCSGLTSVTIGNSVTTIGTGAFFDCKGLTSIEIPSSVTSIGEDAFYGTAWYSNQPDGLVYAGKVAYKYKGTMPENTTISIKEGTLGIAEDAFYNRSGLTSVTIPNSVTSIGERAFYNCSGLTSVTIGNSVTSIGAGAFSGCYDLKKMKVDKTTPISVASDFFNNTANAVLYIPKGSKTLYLSADNWKDFKTIKEFPDGDVNEDEETDVVDVVDIARYVVGTPRDVFDDFLADMNGSGSINVADAVVLVNEIAGDTQFARSQLRTPNHDNDVLSLCHNNEDRLSLQLDGTERYTAFQFDLWLPSDMNLMSLFLNNLRSQGHQLLYNKVEDGHYRVVVMSTSRETFNGTSGELLGMMLDGFASDDIRIDNIHFVTAQGYDVPFNAVKARYIGRITDIKNVEPVNVEERIEKQAIYNLNGQRLEYLRKGINIIGGKKIFVE